jgi:hypothetical protein
MKRVACLIGLAAGLAPSCHEEHACTDEDALALYQRKIAPLLEADEPTSCNECHLAGIDLGIYAQADACATMACMVDRGIVDLDEPDASLVLEWILRAKPASTLIDEEDIAREHDAMLEWIEYNARCGERVCEPIDDPCGAAPSQDDCEFPPPSDAPRPWDDPGDCSDRTLEEMFREKVYAWRGRCGPCHFEDWVKEPFDAPPWVAVGACSVGSLQTMRNVLAAGYVDVAVPANSPLLLKPLDESAGGVMHGGGDKFHALDDPGYLDFRAWIDRYVQCAAP